MLKTTTFLFALFMFVSCGKGGGGGSGSGGDSVSANEVSVNSPVPSAALNFDVSLKLNNFNASQEDKVLTAADLIKKVVGSEEFKNAILNHSYNGKKTFVDNGGLSNAEIYATIIEGSETLSPGTDNQMDLQLEITTQNSNTVGYTYPDEIKIWMNTKYLNVNTPAKVTTNMMHEWLHKLGFKHAQASTASRPYSVPYAVGYLVAKLAKQMS